MAEFEAPKAVPEYDKRVGQGFESIVYSSPTTGYVVKVPNVSRYLGTHDRGEKLGMWIASEEHGRELERENNIAQNVLGDRIISNWFFFGRDIEGIPNVTYLRVQPNVSEKRAEGDFMLWSSVPPEVQQGIIKDPAMQKEVEEVVWSLKAYHYHLGYPFDMKEDNIVYEANEKKFYFLEAGFPSEMKKIVEDRTYLSDVFSLEMRVALIKMMLERLSGPFSAIGAVTVSPERKKELDEKYGLPDSYEYAEDISEMVNRYVHMEQEYRKALLSTS